MRRFALCTSALSQKPACSSRSVASTASGILCNRMVQKTLPGTDNTVMPHQLLQSPMSPFFGIFTIIPCLHSSGTLFALQHLFIRLVSADSKLWPPNFKSSAEISSPPAALLFLVTWWLFVFLLLLYPANSKVAPLAQEMYYYINGTKLPHLFHAVILASKLRLICHLLIL